jgi:hypothetical protein
MKSNELCGKSHHLAKFWPYFLKSGQSYKFEGNSFFVAIFSRTEYSPNLVTLFALYLLLHEGRLVRKERATPTLNVLKESNFKDTF